LGGAKQMLSRLKMQEKPWEQYESDDLEKTFEGMDKIKAVHVEFRG
jgi:hypothetical protein